MLLNTTPPALGNSFFHFLMNAVSRLSDVLLKVVVFFNIPKCSLSIVNQVDFKASAILSDDRHPNWIMSGNKIFDRPESFLIQPIPHITALTNLCIHTRRAL